MPLKRLFSFLFGQKDAGRKSVSATFPFVIHKVDGTWLAQAHIEGDELYPAYFQLFEKHDYYGNGYCWEGHVAEILRALDPALLERLDFDSEAGLFSVSFASREDSRRFTQLLSPIFADRAQLESWIVKADRNAIDD